MKLSNEKILFDSTKLREIAQKQLPIKASYAIAKNMAKIEADIKIYNSEKEKLLKKYAEKDEKDNVITDEKGQVNIEKDKIEEWNKEIQELLSIENEIDIHKFNIAALEGYNLSPAELMVIEYMIEE